MKGRMIIAMLCLSLQLHAQTWEELTDSLSYYYQQNQIRQALPVAENIVKLTAKDNNGQTTRYATALNNLAYLLNQTGEKEKAITYYQSARRLRLSLLEADDEDCLSVVQSLASVYTDLGKFPEAIKCYSDYLQELESRGKKISKAAVMALYRRAVIQLNLQNNDEAKKDLLAITAFGTTMLADTILYYNTYDYLASLMKDDSDLEKTEPVFLRYTELCKMVEGPGSQGHIYSLYNLAGLYTRSGNSARAEPVMREVVAGYASLFGRESPHYKAASLHLSTVLMKIKKSGEATQIIDSLLMQNRQKHGSTSVAYINILHEVSIAVLQGGNRASGVHYLQLALDAARKINDPALIYSRIKTLDSVYNEQDYVMERVPLVKEMILLHESNKLLTDSAYSSILAGLASIYIDVQDYASAFSLTEKYDSVTIRCFKGETEEYLRSRRETAYLYSLMERFEVAEKYYGEALRVATKLWGEHSERYAILLRNIGTLYTDAGQKQKAAVIFKKAADILEKNNSKEFDQLAFIYQKLARAYDIKAKSTEEEYYLIKALQTAQKNTTSKMVFGVLANDLAYFYESRKEFQRADSVYEENRIRMKQTIGKEYIVYLITLAQQSVNAVHWGKKDKAGELVREINSSIPKIYKDSAEWDSRLLTFLGEYYRVTGQYDQAVQIGKKSLQQQVKLMGEDNPALASLLIILCRLFFESNHYAEAKEVVSRLNRITLSSMMKNFEVLSDSEKEKYIANKFNAQHFSNTLLLRNIAIDPEFVTETFSQTLLLKSLILSENRKITESVLQSSDTALQRLYREWLSVRQSLARAYAKPGPARPADLSVTEERAEALQKEITGQSSRLLKQSTSMVRIADLQANLKEDEAIIEFVHFGVFREKADSALYAAFILRKNSKAPVFVPLCEKKELQKLFDSAGTTATTMVSRFYRGTELKSKSAATVLGRQLYQLVWAPLEPYLKGIRSINYSPANKFFNIAFHALPVDSTRILMDQYELHQFSSTRDLANAKTAKGRQPTNSLVLFGDPSFSLDSTAFAKSKSFNRAIRPVTIPEERGSRSGQWLNLPGTAEEVKKIKELFEVNRVPSRSFTQATATEENLKSLSGHSPQVLHIATHGFFLPAEEKKETVTGVNQQNVYSVAEDPLLRTGLVLAGGNRAWSGKEPIEGVEDGIATAYEISQLDLSNTELLVLSACETALGDIKGNEGVFGLQRAFKMAGVKKMILSLWQVPDKETAELMTAFYGYWLKGKSIHEAFAQAQGEMRKKYPPYYWAAFVLVE